MTQELHDKLWHKNCPKHYDTRIAQKIMTQEFPEKCQTIKQIFTNVARQIWHNRKIWQKYVLKKDTKIAWEIWHKNCHSVLTSVVFSVKELTHSIRLPDAQCTLREQSEHTQRTIWQHSEHIQGTLKNTQRTLRGHSEDTHRTLRERLENTQKPPWEHSDLDPVMTRMV